MSDQIISAQWFDDRCYRITKYEGEQRFDHSITSVTTNLGIEEKPFVLKWYADLGWDEARKRLHESQDRGKRIHFAFWVYLNGGIVIYNPWQSPFYSDEQIEEQKKSVNGIFMVLKNQDEMVALWKLQRFMEIVNPTIRNTEKIVYSIEKDIAGTMDVEFFIEKGKYDVNGREQLVIPKSGVYVADLKTGNSIGSVWEQLAAYTEALEEMRNTEIDGALCLHTSASTRSGIEGFSANLKMREELKPHYDMYKHLAAAWKFRNPNFGPKVFEFPTKIQRRLS